MKSALPILYSFRRCPYAIRAMLAITYSEIPVEIREVQLKQKPEHMLAISPKGTVPVLELPDGKVIDESLDIMRWALAQNDPEQWMDAAERFYPLIQWNDGEFKYYLDRYKYADRYPAFSKDYYRQEAEKFLAVLEAKLGDFHFLGEHRFSLVDAAILPFIRQFAAVDNTDFLTSQYPFVKRWLTEQTTSNLFTAVMLKPTVA